MDRSFLRLTKGPFWVFYRSAALPRKLSRSVHRFRHPERQKAAFTPPSGRLPSVRSAG